MFSEPVATWFEGAFDGPTDVQDAAWQAIADGRDTLVAAPTGSGKTLAAFLNAIDDLVRRSHRAPLPDRVLVLYVSPLKALSNDIHRNLEAPLAGIEAALAGQGAPAAGIRAAVRTGDTPAGERAKMAKRPPHILVTTPESLYLLLTSDSGRAMLEGVETVIVDEIHAVAGSKRGSHLSLSLARLDALCAARPRRIGLSATQKPIEVVGQFLTGGGDCAIVDTGHRRAMDLALEMTDSPLTAVMANEAWTEIYDRLAELADGYRTTLIFVNTRRLAERVARHLAERLGEDAVTAHHGSLSREHRLESEQALKEGRLRALVATASLELGIDIGHVDLVCQLGSPGGISALLQRVGRSGHTVGGLPRGRLFPLSRDDLVECAALLRAVSQGQLDAIRMPEAPLDVLAQQLVAEVSAREWRCDELFHAVRRSWPYRELAREQFDGVVRMLSEGYATRRGRRSAWLFHDAVNGRLRARPAARLTALQNGGAIPDQFDYDVILVPRGVRIGTLGEDFSFESLPGDIFQLGNSSFRILKVEQGRVLVEDAAGLPPTLPFWVGDRPGRSDELSEAVSSLRGFLQQAFETGDTQAARNQLADDGLPAVAVDQLLEYLQAAWQAMGTLPTDGRIVLERFFDDTGDMHLVVHAPLGSRLMRAWGLALRKRFCRQFNFELQASALEDALILSLGETHSFELADVAGYLKPATAESVLTQALLDAPMFDARWRWDATIALAVQRMRNGRRLPAQWQRNQAEDLVSVVFPDQIACAENLAGAREIPDHPLVHQAIDDCLRDTMDVDGLVRLLEGLQAGDIEVHCADLTGPSPLAREIINARPYAFLDDGEAEDRRTRAISAEPDDLGRADTLRIISVEATRQVREEAWIRPRDADELHDGLLQLGFLARHEYTNGQSRDGAGGHASRWAAWFEALADDHRACRVTTADGWDAWVAAERLGEVLAVHGGSERTPGIEPIGPVAEDEQAALVALLRDRLTGLGPVAAESLSLDFGLPQPRLLSALEVLRAEGFAIRMEGQNLWCERRLLARIHRYSREHRRQSVRPVSPEAFMHFLAAWHALSEPVGLDQALGLLEGWSAPVDAWESALLRARCGPVEVPELDQRFLSGTLAWFRPLQGQPSAQQVVASSPVALVPRGHLAHWRQPHARAAGEEGKTGLNTSGYGTKIIQSLTSGGALFMDDLERDTGMLAPQLEDGLKSLVYQGRIHADAFSPLRWLLRPESAKRRQQSRRRGTHAVGPVGRWSLLPDLPADTDRPADQGQQRMATVCDALLRRYGVVFRAVLAREPMAPPWRDILRYLRRMEDRGEVRGGHFVDGFSGEQFALPEAIGALRQAAVPVERPALAVISATDPLNLGGYLVPGPRTPATMGNRILLEGGLPVARLVNGEAEMLPGISDRARRSASERLTIVTPWRKAR
ncbi:DEAD/DEAH box helicase [Marinihelvus fidelis]|uniref:DEAD/DEAH box helicase n=1 Tax=Marinihelvus fidelis TaxID=2613842 RepID=A0A5N0TFR8_9GAMM|nr:DEAD/DEAH box helicase [Marinihelvus fidelis]